MSPEMQQRYEQRISRVKVGRELDTIRTELRALFPADEATGALLQAISEQAAAMAAPSTRAASRGEGVSEPTRASSRVRR
jgi:hypothetical protein